MAGGWTIKSVAGGHQAAADPAFRALSARDLTWIDAHAMAASLAARLNFPHSAQKSLLRLITSVHYRVRCGAPIDRDNLVALVNAAGMLSAAAPPTRIIRPATRGAAP